VSYCHLDLMVAFFLLILFVDLAIHFFYLWHFVILVLFVALVTTLFVVSRYLIKDILLMLSLSHNLIPLLALYDSVSHHLFGLTPRLGLHSMTTLKS
jgi:hypothetical protein